jgi:hypothetical protein
MNELDLISRFQEGDHPPDADARDRTRTRLMDVITTSARLDRAPTQTRGGRGRRVGMAVAAAVAVALIVVLIVPGGAPNASATLLRLSKVAVRGPGWESPSNGQYVYTRVVSRSPSCDANGCILEDVRRDSWVARDGSGRVVEDRSGQLSDQTFAPGTLPFDDLHEVLGLSQDQVRQYLLQRIGGAGADQDFALFVKIGRILGETLALPEARMALFQLAASLPDTQDLGEMSDHLGRTGIGIGYTSEGVQHQIIFDGDTALVLGEQNVQVDGSSGAGTSSSSNPALPGSWTAYSDSGLVGSLDVRT